MKQKRAGGWCYYFVAGVAVLACNRTAGCMLHSVPFSALFQIVGCMLERVHPCRRSRSEFIPMPRKREMSLEMNSCKLSAASIFVVLISKETLYPR